jgi:hypothetical protein
MADSMLPRTADGACDLVGAIRQVLRASHEPLTAPAIHKRLPPAFRGVRLEALTDVLERQVAAHVLVVCPKYRSPQDRYWDRSLRDHVKVLLQDVLREGPLPWSELRRRLPKYARHLAESVLNEQLAHGALFRHPPAHARIGPRYALHPPDARRYLRPAVDELFDRMAALDFSRADVRQALQQMLDEEERWPGYTYAPADGAEDPFLSADLYPPS